MLRETKFELIYYQDKNKVGTQYMFKNPPCNCKSCISIILSIRYHLRTDRNRKSGQFSGICHNSWNGHGQDNTRAGAYP